MCAGSSGIANSTVQATKTMTSWEWDWESTEQSKWVRLAAVVDSGTAGNVLPAGVCNHVKLSATRRSEAGIGFHGAGGERIRNHSQRKLKVRLTDGMWREGSTWQVTDVKRPLMSVAQMVASRASCASRQQGSQDSQTEGDVTLLRKAGHCSSSISGSEKTQQAGKPGFHRQA